MAYKKKTVASVEPLDVETDEMAESTETAQETKTVKNTSVEKQKKTFTDSDYVLCRSVWYGGLNVTCRSGNYYEFTNYGAECDINYRDLVDLVRKGSEHIFLPRFVIVDEDFIDAFPNLKRVYASLYTNADLLEILELPTSRMRTEIAKLPDEARDVLCKMVATEIANGHLDSISKVRALSEIFNSDFNLLSELFVK